MSPHEGGPARLVDDPAVPEEHHPVGPGGQLGIVGDDHRGHTATAGGEQESHHRLAVDRIEGARGLVGQQQTPVAYDGAGDRDPLALAA